MRKYIIALILLLSVFFSSNQTKGQDFYHSYVYADVPEYSAGYGLLYNWYATQDQQTGIKYGYLYNWYAATDARNITSDGWHVPTLAEVNTLGTIVTNANTIKDIGLTYWENDYGTNEYGFNARGGGHRCTETKPSFYGINRIGYFMTSDYSYDSVNNWYGLGFLLTSSSYIYGGPVWLDHNTGFNWRTTGFAIRPVKNSTILTHGQTGTYTGNDGRVYRTICIGTQEWLADNLSETKYRNGDLIPEVTDNTAWAALTTGARCSYNNDESNAFTTTNIAPAGWRVPTMSDFQALRDYLGGTAAAGGKVKETGYVYWNIPNTGATNESGFSARGAGARYENGYFEEALKTSTSFWTSTEANATYARMVYLTHNSSNYVASDFGGSDKKRGYSIRLIKNDSTWSPGDAINDNDGNVYGTIKIGDQVWLTSNWKCTSYADGTPIPNVTDNTEWTLLSTPAWCIYDNNPLNK